MTRRLSLMLTLALALAIAFADAGIHGAWRGAIGPGIIDLEIRVSFAAHESGTGLTASLDIPAQGLLGFPLADVTLDGDTIRFAMPGVPGDPTFEGVVADDVIDGTFVQGGQPLPFILAREHDTGASLRPQEPLPPFPYDEEEVTFASGDVVLAGTLTLPRASSPAAGLLLIAGSGAQDRNEEILGHKPFLVIADHLTRAGYAVLRVDDRGVGGSSGSDADATFEDMIGDVLAGVELLRSHSRVDAERVGLLGHSQGGYLAPVAALESDGGVAFAILLAGPALDGFSVLAAQNERILEASMRAADPTISDEAIAAVIDCQLAFLEALYERFLADDVPGARALVRQRIEDEMAAMEAEQRLEGALLEDFIALQQEGVASPAFRSFVTFDPQPYLRRLTIPTLAIYGDLDLQVPADQSEAPMREALAGNPSASVVTFAGLNHLLQPAVTGGLDEYGAIEITIDPIVLETITRWLRAWFPVR